MLYFDRFKFHAGNGVFLHFFFKQKSAYDVRISDWSSDVCSSDLPEPGIARDKQLRDAVIEAILDNLSGTLPRDSRVITIAFTSPDPALAARIANKIGRASCRESVWQYV